jgi:hypothetical protein
MFKEFTFEATKRGIPPLYAQEAAHDPLIYAHIELLLFDWNWFVMEAEVKNDDILFFGYVQENESELGYFSLKELTATNHPIKIKWFDEPVTLSQIKQKYNL